jgi:NifU-like protein involved in Fe-S cluster formation
MSDDPLYRKDLLRLAADADGAGRLPQPHASGMAHNPVCADRVCVELRLENGRIAALAHQTRACVLAQASASLLGRGAAGLTKASARALHQQVAAMLAGGAAPDAPFDGYAVFNGVTDRPARHKCVLLPLEALLAALEAAGADMAAT